MWTRTEFFGADESGTITADWVVLTASSLILAVAVVASVKSGTVALGPAISTEIERALN